MTCMMLLQNCWFYVIAENHRIHFCFLLTFFFSSVLQWLLVHFFTSVNQMWRTHVSGSNYGNSWMTFTLCLYCGIKLRQCAWSSASYTWNDFLETPNWQVIKGSIPITKQKYKDSNSCAKNELWQNAGNLESRKSVFTEAAEIDMSCSTEFVFFKWCKLSASWYLGWFCVHSFVSCLYGTLLYLICMGHYI